MKIQKLFFIVFLTLVFATFTNAQNKENYSYKDLLNQQKIEREELKLNQNEVLDKIITRQKEETEHIAKNTLDYINIRSDHQKERENIVNRFTLEREKLMSIQADERKRFSSVRE